MLLLLLFLLARATIVIVGATSTIDRDEEAGAVDEAFLARALLHYV